MKKKRNQSENKRALVLRCIFPGILLLAIAFHSRHSTPAFSELKSIPERPNNLRERVKQIYTSQIGVPEKPQNSGPEVEKYLRYVGLPKGNPWCAAFVCWALGEAGVANPRSGWSPDLFARKRVIWDRSSQPKADRSKPMTYSPQPTDVFGLYFTEKRRLAHVGFIDSWDGTWVITVEGNTNDSGAREGDGVYRKRRLVKTLYQVARYID